MSVVICVRNVMALLRNSLPTIKQQLPRAEIIVVDGDSTDGTVEFARTIAEKVISDEKRGLAYARQLGINNATRPFVAFVGPDNIVSAEMMYAMQHALEKDPMLAAVAPQTEVIDAHSYWECATKYIFQYFINHPGPVDVVGTPCMYKRDVVSRIQYDPKIRAAGDDTDLSLRLMEAGYTLAIIDAYTQEKNELDAGAFRGRWRWYGRGDAEFYTKHRASWSVHRRLRSLLHPFRKYVVRGTLVFFRQGKFLYIPALYVAVWSRYRGWWGRARELQRERA